MYSIFISRIIALVNTLMTLHIFHYLITNKYEKYGKEILFLYLYLHDHLLNEIDDYITLAQ